MRETIKLAIRLMVFALAAALLLAVVNTLTKDKIAFNTNAKINAARIAVLGNYTFEDTQADVSDCAYIKGIYAAYDGETPVGYVYEMSSSGYGGTINLSVGILVDGSIANVKVSSHTETKGLGTDAEATFMDAFTGLVSGTDSALDVDAMSGATVSSTAVRVAIDEAMNHFAENYRGEDAAQ